MLRWEGLTLRIAPGFRWPDTVKLRRAAVAHPCDMGRATPAGIVRRWDGGPMPEGHTVEIPRGAQYVEDFAETAPYQSGARFCAACAVAAGIAEWTGEGIGDWTPPPKVLPWLFLGIQLPGIGR